MSACDSATASFSPRGFSGAAVVLSIAACLCCNAVCTVAMADGTLCREDFVLRIQPLSGPKREVEASVAGAIAAVSLAGE